jgi:hypothetical protein
LLLYTCCFLPPLQKLRSSTGFSPVEVFRKYLWFLLRERKFDAAAVEDMVLLKSVLGLSDEQVCCGLLLPLLLGAGSCVHAAVFHQ